MEKGQRPVEKKREERVEMINKKSEVTSGYY